MLFHWTLGNPYQVQIVTTIFQFRNFGACLLKIRMDHELSQKAVAIIAGMDQSYLAGMEAGRRSPPREKQLLRLIEAIQATPEEEKELRESHAFARLVGIVDEIDPERGRALAALAFRFLSLSSEEIKIVESLASMLGTHVKNLDVR